MTKLARGSVLMLIAAVVLYAAVHGLMLSRHDKPDVAPPAKSEAAQPRHATSP